MKNEPVVISTSVLQMCIARGYEIKSLYVLHTTGIIKYALAKEWNKLPSIKVHEYSDLQMSDFAKFYTTNSMLLTLGFNDSSAVHLALNSGYPLMILDILTERVCKNLGIECLWLSDTLEDQIAQIGLRKTEPAMGNESIRNTNTAFLY